MEKSKKIALSYYSMNMPILGQRHGKNYTVSAKKGYNSLLRLYLVTVLSMAIDLGHRLPTRGMLTP